MPRGKNGHGIIIHGAKRASPLFAALALALLDIPPGATRGPESIFPPVGWVTFREQTRVTSRECRSGRVAEPKHGPVVQPETVGG
jgi:hypothetical protein